MSKQFEDEDDISNINADKKNEDFFNDADYEKKLDIINEKATSNIMEKEGEIDENDAKEISLSEALQVVLQKLEENSSIESKSTGFKIILEKIQESKVNKVYVEELCQWLLENNILEKFLHDDSHAQILRKMPLILKFLYENNQIELDWIIKFMVKGLVSHEEYLKVNQSLLNFLSVEHLSLIYAELLEHKNLENTNLSHMLSTMITNKNFLQTSTAKSKSKNVKENQESILEEIERSFDQEELIKSANLILACEDAEEYDQESEHDKIVKSLANGIFSELIKLSKNNGVIYVPVLNKLISLKHDALFDLIPTLVELLKNENAFCLWIIEHCLKMDFGQPSKEKGQVNQKKYNFISSLVTEGLYEYIICYLAKNRFAKNITDKALNILILLSKNYKPLDASYTVYVWKILGLHAREEKQREQFFDFVKNNLRNQSSFTEESVNFIFFQILMKLSWEWFSMKIFECFEMLFMRLNEDLKLISYNDQKYSIEDADLIGLEKFWYIYFNVLDAKVVKKCKQVLWKLTTFDSNIKIKKELIEKYINKILRSMTESNSPEKAVMTSKGFDMIDIMMEEKQKKGAGASQFLQLVIKNETTEAVPPKIINLQISEKACLSNLREQIIQSITPSISQIKLLLRGEFLKGEKMTLKELSIHTGQTIMVINDQFEMKGKQDEKQAVKQNAKQLIQIFGAETDHGLLTFVAEKMEGETIEKIMDFIMDESKMNAIRQEYSLKNLTDEEDNDSIKNNCVSGSDRKELENDNTNAVIFDSSPENLKELEQPAAKEEPETKQIKFSRMLLSEPQNIKILLCCAQQDDYVRGWESIKKLPVCSKMIEDIEHLALQGKWELIFSRNQSDYMFNIYNSHLLKKIFKNQEIMKECLIKRKGYQYLVEWLETLLDSKNYLHLSMITELVLIPLEVGFSALALYEKRIEKEPPVNLLNTLIEQNYIEEKLEIENCFTTNLISRMINMIIDPERNFANSMFPSMNIQKLLLYNIVTAQSCSKILLGLSKFETYDLLRLHGFSGEYLLIYAIARSIVHKIDIYSVLKNLLSDLLEFCFVVLPAQQFNNNLISVYDTIKNILDYENVGQGMEKSVIKQSTQVIIDHSSTMAAGQLFGILQVLKVCLENLSVLGQMSEQSEITQLLPSFGFWLFQTYLFNFENPHIYIRDKNIRRLCYKILEVICKNQNEFAEMMCDSVVSINIQPRPKDEDYIDFRTKQYIGIQNLGATCYINSLIQQIYHTKFSKLLLQEQDDLVDQPEIKMKQLKKIFMQLYSSIKNVVNPTPFIKSISFYGEPIAPNVQQDATEFLLCLFDYIQSEGSQQQIHEVFGGYLCNQITVGDNNSLVVKNNCEHFNTLTVDIKGKKNLQQALVYFTKPQILDGENMYYSEELGKKTKALKRTFLEKNPNILIITLKRFEFDYDSQSRYKLNDYFEFPFDLDMHKYTATHLRDKEEFSDSKYKLSGILVHSGSAESGHYYSYIKIGQKWYEFNDKNVTEFNIASNLKSECFGSSDQKKTTKNAYMLFYEKVDSHYHGVYINQISESNPLRLAVKQENAQFLKNRLVYDENFKKFLEKLSELTLDSRIEEILKVLSGKSQDFFNSSHPQNNAVHFDIDDESFPLLPDHQKQKQQNFDEFFDNPDTEFFM